MATANIYDLADTWNDGLTTFTAIKMDVTDTASASGSLLMDLKIGGSSKFSVRKDGTLSSITSIGDDSGDGPVYIYIGAPVQGSIVGVSNTLFFGSGATSFTPQFKFRQSYSPYTGSTLTIPAAGSWQLGAIDAGAPEAQTLSVQSVSTGTLNTAGQDFTIQGSAGTGSGAGGSIIFQVAPAGGSGTGQNTLVDALTIGSDKSTTFAGNLSVSAGGGLQILV